MYKVQISHRNDDFSKWSIHAFENEWVCMDPTTIFHEKFRKLFHNDVFSLGPNGPELIESSVRKGVTIPAVLIIEGSKTYGREKKTNKLLYKCVPDDVHLPAFLVPYEMKQVGFSKVFLNLYVTIVFDHWQDKHPRGKLDCVIGSVDIAEHFYEYQLYCKSLHVSLQKFNKAVLGMDREKALCTVQTKFPHLEDRIIQRIISIDPPNSVDIDDAFGFVERDDGIHILSVYISNVSLWLDAMQLWSAFSQRVATIYLPDRKRPMLPTILSDCLCSLQQKVNRVAFVMDLFLRDGEIEEIRFGNAVVQVSRNYVYEEEELLRDDLYQTVLTTVQDLSKKLRYIPQVKNSHDLVSYLMILTNYCCARELAKRKTGIFRSTLFHGEIEIPDCVPQDVAKAIKIIKSTSGQYLKYSDEGDLRHAMMNMDAYVHMTSPIRRLVDLLNMIQFHTSELSAEANEFLSEWLRQLDYINVTMRSIRKVQSDCSLLDLCQRSSSTMETEYECYLFDKVERQDGLFRCVAYIPELKLTSQIIVQKNVEEYERRLCKLILFEDEEKLKRKIRLQLV
jgi:exoribonuclease R